ncbi:hypothetical protein [Rhizobium sp. SGZ-381]|uniref:hypothetical protein n=1 Tax=Rhizobium sp. SGZ-381 TaxID=3342800 RepID=UPI00367179E5
MALEVVSPADWTDCLTCAGGRALARKAAIWMRSRGQTVALFEGGQLLAVAYLVPDDAGRLEFCLSILPDAKAHMMALCRFAHSTLARIADHGAVVICRVMAGNRSGARMARLCGFQHAGGVEWILTGERDVTDGFRPFRGRRQIGAARGGEEPPAADGGE